MVSLAELLDQDPALTRLELIGLLARISRLALQECEQADSVEFSVSCGPDGLTVDCALFTGTTPVGGWGM